MPSRKRPRKKLDHTPKLWAPDGTRLLCCFGGEPGEWCRLRATYPDGACCEHTKWLTGTTAERRNADDSKQTGGKTRRAAWDISRKQRTDLKTPKP